MKDYNPFPPSNNKRPPEISDTDLLFYIETILPIEDEWKKSQPRFTFRQWIDLFKPEAIAPTRKNLKVNIKKCKEHLTELGRQHEEYYDNRINKAHFLERAELKEWSDRMYEEAREQTLSLIKKATFNLSYLNELEGKLQIKITGGVNEIDIDRAKEVPIENFYAGTLKKNSIRSTGLCPFHNEDTASFVIYTKQNTWWCFGCNTGGSVIDFIMKQENLDFLHAVKKLLK